MINNFVTSLTPVSEMAIVKTISDICLWHALSLKKKSNITQSLHKLYCPFSKFLKDWQSLWLLLIHLFVQILLVCSDFTSNWTVSKSVLKAILKTKLTILCFNCDKSIKPRLIVEIAHSGKFGINSPSIGHTCPCDQAFTQYVTALASSYSTK